MNPQPIHPQVSAHLSRIGQKGGRTTGVAKRRGDAEHYKALAAKAVAARLAKKNGGSK